VHCPRRCDCSHHPLRTAFSLSLSSLSSLARFASFARTQLKEMLRFNPDRGAMKKRLESLIDREYVERDMTDRAVVHYMPA